MKRIFVLLLAALALGACGRPSAVRDAIDRQLQTYPESRVQDIYKNFCQDKLGPEHLIPDAASARAYLLSELDQYREELEASGGTSAGVTFYPLGDEGNYVRSTCPWCSTGRSMRRPSWMRSSAGRTPAGR